MRPITAADVMNPRVLSVREDMTIQELAHFLVANEISGAPVTDEDGRLVGVVSMTDIVQAVAEDDEDDEDRTGFFDDAWGGGWTQEDMEDLELDDEVEVQEIMTPEIHSVPAETPVSEVAETMIRTHIHRLLVTRDDKVVGILSTSDLLGLLVEERV
jgi:CBS domain-containing protein